MPTFEAEIALPAISEGGMEAEEETASVENGVLWQCGERQPRAWH